MARRTAERAARDLIRSRAADIGDLGVAKSAVEVAVAGVDTGIREARELVEAARVRSDQLVIERRVAVEDATVAYTRAYLSALKHGWRAEELQGMGFRPPTNAMKSEARRRGQTEEPTPPAGSEAAVTVRTDNRDEKFLGIRADGDDRPPETA